MKNIQKGITAILFAVVIVASVLVGMAAAATAIEYSIVVGGRLQDIAQATAAGTVAAYVTAEQATAAGTVVPLTATATDIFGADLMITSSGELAIYPLGSTTVTFTAKDNSGNTASCTTTVTVVDTTAPVITCPADVTVEQATAAGTVVPLTATATDIFNADPKITSSGELAIYPLGSTTVTFTAEDDSGNTASGTTTVTVEDTTAPIITCPADVTVEQATAAGTVVPLTATATDICDADPKITSSGELAIYPLGSTTVTFTAEDDSGNTASGTTTVTVEDTTAPVITCPADVTVEQATAAGTVVPLTATATDICDADPVITSSGELAIYPLGSTTVTFTAEDDSGNTASCTTTVTVVDRTDPVITCPADVTEEQATAAGTVVPLTATATDTCDADVDITNDAPAIFPLGMTTVTFTATDDSGNIATCSMTVTVVDTIPPDISVTVSPDTLWPPNHKMVDITASVTVSDICDAAPSVVLTSVTSNEPDYAKGKPRDSQDSTSGDGSTITDIQGAEIGTEDYEFQLRADRAGKGDGRVYTITYMVTDESGNSASASATVVVPHDMG